MSDKPKFEHRFAKALADKLVAALHGLAAEPFLPPAPTPKV